MKTLTLIRHAKSSWQHAGLDDIDRPLNNRGERNAPDMAARLKRFSSTNPGYSTGELDSSTARRAHDAAMVFASALGDCNNIVATDHLLYAFDSEELLNWIHLLNDRQNAVTVVGHNPALTELVNELGESYHDNLPTCAVVVLYSDVLCWHAIDAGSCSTIFYDYPKNHSQ